MIKSHLAIAVLLTFMSQQAICIDIRHAQAREGSTLDQYAIDLIKFLVKRSGQSGNYIPYQPPGSQTRKEFQLNSGDYDIDWFGSTSEIEGRAIPIRVPIFRGLLGYRVFITNATTSNKLYKDMPLAELQKFKLIQGQGWGDIAVLQSGGYNNIKSISNFKNIFKMIEHERVDLFPRSITEPYGELGSRCNLSNDFKCKDKNMLIDDKLMVVYKLPMFFFVSPKRKDLIKLISNAFENDYEAFLEFFNNHPLIKDALNKMQNRSIYTITNNQSLSADTNNIPDKYWLRTN